MNEKAIVLANVSKIYAGGVRALDGVSLGCERGEWVALMGASGSGKTTLLNLLDGLDRPEEGRVWVLGRDLSALSPSETCVFRRENIGLVFQQFHLVPYLSALENVMLAQYFHSMTDRREAMRALDAVDMGHRAGHLPSQLSGGEQQRVCIARALINNPNVVLADEPTGNLDEANEEKVFEIFQRLHRDGRTLVVATHDRTLGALAERVIELNHGRLVGRGEHGSEGPSLERGDAAAAPS